MGLIKRTAYYDPDQTTINLGGVPIEDGWADGEFIRVVQDNVSFELVEGTDGEFTRSKRHGMSLTVTITLMQTSTHNALLSALHLADRKAANGAGVVPFFMKDRGGATLVAAPQAWVEKMPDSPRDRTATARAWTIRCINPEWIEGGN